MPDDFSTAGYGLAFDIGTTTVDARLVTSSGQASFSEKNAQTRWGADIISRIGFANEGEENRMLLKTTILRQLEGIAARLFKDQGIDGGHGMSKFPGRAVITGNATMLHFLTGYSTARMAAAPFEMESLFGFEISWGDLYAGHGPDYASETLSPNMPVFLPPAAGTFTGPDLISALTAVLSRREAETTAGQSGETAFLLADIGTNCEIAFYCAGSGGPSEETLICAATAAGPAFEGGGIRHGMRAASGAICRAVRKNNAFILETIGGKETEGICGTGLVSAAACILDAGLMDETGLLLAGPHTGEEMGKAQIVLYEKGNKKIVLTQADIRNLQLAKGAVRSGLDMLLEEARFDCRAIPLYLCGAFGSFMDATEASRIGLIPVQCAGAAISAGNAALDGAALMLFSEEHRKRAQHLAYIAQSINLAEHPDFQNRFISSLNFYWYPSSASPAH
ncbi:MAG: ASKHA domain-containing protein [Treponema sp.]|jgi:uncharacterized 2Fe-2S/4Fe-4S cluster protein (DUF4445 family)|nr:ASKHA domain-containing protein [Treponema sp.]